MFRGFCPKDPDCHNLRCKTLQNADHDRKFSDLKICFDEKL